MSFSSAAEGYYTNRVRDLAALEVDISTRARVDQPGILNEAIVLGYRVYGDTRSGFVVERAVVSYMPMFPELPGGNTNGAPGSQTFCDSLLASDEIPTVTVELASMTALAQLVVGDFDRKKYITRETTRPPFERTRSTVVKFGSLGDSRVPECLILQVDEVHHLSENNNQRCDATGFHPRN